MKFIVSDDYTELSIRATDDFVDRIKSMKNPVVCTASGESPAGLYKEIVRRVSKKQLDISDWFFLGLDEWMGMNGDDEGSCRYHLNEQFFHPLKIAGERICFFDGRATDPDEECERIENFIQNHNGIDIAILGLGMNGHVGMNEPGTPQNMRSHVADLHNTTQEVGQKYFKKQKKLTRGITLGLADLMDAKHVMLLINGEKKASIVQKVFEDDISEQLPASLLRRHPNFIVYLDAEAAQQTRIHLKAHG